MTLVTAPCSLSDVPIQDVVGARGNAASSFHRGHRTMKHRYNKSPQWIHFPVVPLNHAMDRNQRGPRGLISCAAQSAGVPETPATKSVVGSEKARNPIGSFLAIFSQATSLLPYAVLASALLSLCVTLSHTPHA